MTEREHTRSWHVGRAFSGHELEDACPCPQEACGLVSRNTIVPACPDHGIEARKAIRQGHRADACPGSRSEEEWVKIYDDDEAWLAEHADEIQRQMTPSRVTRPPEVTWEDLKAEILDPEDMAFVERYREELVESLNQLRRGEVMPALTVAETRVREAENALLAFVGPSTTEIVRTAFLEAVSRYRDAVLGEASRALEHLIDSQEWSDERTDGMVEAHYAVRALVTDRDDAEEDDA